MINNKCYLCNNNFSILLFLEEKLNHQYKINTVKKKCLKFLIFKKKYNLIYI